MTVVDRNPDRLRVAQEVGVADVGVSADDVARPGGWDVVIDCTGVVAAIEDALTRVRRGGTFLQFGVAPSEAGAQFSPFRVYHDEITVAGSMAVLHSYGRAVELFAAGVLDAEAMVSHAFCLDDYAEALELFRTGRGRKLQIRPQATTSVELR